MYFLWACLFLPMINAIVMVKIHRSAIYNPVSSCAFLGNISWSTDASIQSCVWECVHENNCQTAVYFSDENVCSMFAESCKLNGIQSSGNVRASVICYPKNQEPFIACPSTVTPNQVEETTTVSVMVASIPPTTTSTSSTTSGATTTATTSTTMTTRALIYGPITQTGDTIVGIYNTTAGMSAGGVGTSNPNEHAPNAIDGLTSTKYFNFGRPSGQTSTIPQPGIGSGFYVTPNVSNSSVTNGLRFATGNDMPNRDPITITLEGSNATNGVALTLGSSWTLIYNGSTGISSISDPGRGVYVVQQNFSNTISYASYRLLVTLQRGGDMAVQYSEAEIIGYY